MTLVRDDRVQIRMPHFYVAAHVELGYATTASRCQGRTVDTTHALIDRSFTRESLYVAFTRAQTSTTI